MGDAFYWALNLSLLAIPVAIIMLLYFKPDKKIILSALLSSIIFSLFSSLIEAFATIIDLWWYNGSYMIAGIPITVFTYFFLSGFNMLLFYDGFPRKFNMSEKYRKWFLPIFISIMLTVAVSVDVLGSQADADYWHFLPGWTPFHIAIIWLSLWMVLFGSFRFLKNKIS